MILLLYHIIIHIAMDTCHDTMHTIGILLKDSAAAYFGAETFLFSNFSYPSLL